MLRKKTNPKVQPAAHLLFSLSLSLVFFFFFSKEYAVGSCQRDVPHVRAAEGGGDLAIARIKIVREDQVLHEGVCVMVYKYHFLSIITVAPVPRSSVLLRSLYFLAHRCCCRRVCHMVLLVLLNSTSMIDYSSTEEFVFPHGRYCIGIRQSVRMAVSPSFSVLRITLL